MSDPLFNQNRMKAVSDHIDRISAMLADFYYSDPTSLDVTEAMMKRILTLEERVRELEKK